MSTKRVLIYLTQKQYEKIKELVYKDGVTMSHVIRNSLDQFLDIETANEPSKQPLSPEELEELLNSRTPDERYLFDPEIIRFHREMKAREENKDKTS